ncbi:MAG: non-hydrolyzing UDP-N-acetylglucosamine 2-epimerase [Campylobacterales bacterium]
MILHLIAAARPNFMKIAPLYHELIKHPEYNVKIVHTGQHYDANMSDKFFEDLRLPKPHIHLGIGGGSHAQNVGNTMIEYEKVCLEEKPDLVIVVGDVNATMACSITAKKLGVLVAHLEAGIRSFDMTMPEEINRKVTDSIVDHYWTPSIEANENLVKEGIDNSKIKLVGNIMIDSFEMMKDDIKIQNTYQKYQLKPYEYSVATFHRPSNVDELKSLKELVVQLSMTSEMIKIILPLHPRTKANLMKHNLLGEFENNPNILILEPLGYKDFMNLVLHCKLVLTDSGGVQEETTYLKIPCLTFRDNTERPVTVWEGTNTLCKLSEMKEYVEAILDGRYKSGTVPILWDGDTAKRVVDAIDRMEMNS